MGHRAGQENLLESVHNVFNLTFVDGEEASGGEGVRDGAASRRSNACVVQQRHEDRLEVFEDVLNVVDGVELEAEEDAEVAAGDDLGTFSFLERSLDDVGERHAAVVDEIRDVLGRLRPSSNFPFMKQTIENLLVGDLFQSSYLIRYPRNYCLVIRE